MSAASTDAEPREIGRIVGSKHGPTLIAVGAIHGNEHAGVHAARRVIERLERVNVHGELLAIKGNVGAMRTGRRYQTRDLNRVWSDEHVASLEARVARGSELDAEDREQLEILTVIRGAVHRARGPVYLVDLHTTSAHGVPFVLFGDTLAQRAFTGGLPLPVILGLEEQVDGVLSAYWTRQGCVTFGVEGGQHNDPASIDNLEAVLLLAAATAGVFDQGEVPELRDAHALLERRRGNLPRVTEVLASHAIAEDDAFTMEPGFLNLDRARANQLLARDRHGEIRAPRDGLVILPLYQKQGSDGFFWGRSVSATRLRASATLRRLRIERLLELLPGIARDRVLPSRLIVHRSVAHLYPRGIFQMLGYRRIRQEANEMTAERQPG